MKRAANVRQFPDAQEWSEVLILRVDAPIFFANLNPIRQTVEYYQRRTKQHLDSHCIGAHTSNPSPILFFSVSSKRVYLVSYIYPTCSFPSSRIFLIPDAKWVHLYLS